MHIRYLLLFLFISFQSIYSAGLSTEDQKRFAAISAMIDATSKEAAAHLYGAPFTSAATANPQAKPPLQRSYAIAGAMAAATKEEAAAHASSSSSAAAPVNSSPTATILSPRSPTPTAVQTHEDAQSCTVASIRNDIAKPANSRKRYWIINPNSSEKAIAELDFFVKDETQNYQSPYLINLKEAFSLFDKHYTKEEAETEKAEWLKLTAHRRYTFWTYTNGTDSSNAHTVFPIARYTVSTGAILASMKGYPVFRYKE